MTNPVSLPCFCCLYDVLSFLTPCNTSTFLTLGNWQYTLLCMLYINFLFTIQPEDVLQLAETCTYIDVLIKYIGMYDWKLLVNIKEDRMGKAYNTHESKNITLVSVGLRELKWQYTVSSYWVMNSSIWLVSLSMIRQIKWMTVKYVCTPDAFYDTEVCMEHTREEMF